MIKPTQGFQSMKTAFATLKRFEVMRMFRKKQMNVWILNQAILREKNSLFNKYDYNS